MRYVVLFVLLVTQCGYTSVISVDDMMCSIYGSGKFQIQQVDEDCNPVPYDCKNIEVTVENEGITRVFQQGKYLNCYSKMFKGKWLESYPMTLHMKIEGKYQVIVKRHNEVSVFQNLNTETDDRGCHRVPEILEVHFDGNN